jgi:hypothetical protein
VAIKPDEAEREARSVLAGGGSVGGGAAGTLMNPETSKRAVPGPALSAHPRR